MAAAAAVGVGAPLDRLLGGVAVEFLLGGGGVVAVLLGLLRLAGVRGAAMGVATVASAVTKAGVVTVVVVGVVVVLRKISTVGGQDLSVVFVETRAHWTTLVDRVSMEELAVEPFVITVAGVGCHWVSVTTRV